MIGADPRLAPEVVEQRVRFRMQRHPTTTDITIILGEGALQLVVGSPAIMAAQLTHLQDVPARVRALPFAAGPSPRRHPFALLEFTDPDDPAVAYVEAPGGARYYDRADERAEYEFVSQLLMTQSVPIKELI